MKGGAMGFGREIVKSIYQAGAPSMSECPVRSDELFCPELWASLLGTHPDQNVTWHWGVAEAQQVRVRLGPVHLETACPVAIGR